MKKLLLLPALIFAMSCEPREESIRLTKRDFMLIYRSAWVKGALAGSKVLSNEYEDLDVLWKLDSLRAINKVYVDFK